MFSAISAHGQSSTPLGELFPLDTGAPQQLQQIGTGMPVVDGSELSAGVAPARFRLARGGEMRICPNSSLNASAGKFGLLLAMGPGAIELDYRIPLRSSDTLLTPDFSMQLLGPGKFHFAMGVDKKGDTCFRGLPGNLSEAVISELMGTGIYKTKPGESVSFPGGRLSAAKPLVGDCGCPPASATMLAKVNAQVPESHAAVPQPSAPAPAQMMANGESAPLPPDKPGQVHIEVETPFVFSARKAANLEPYSVAKVDLSNLPNVLFSQEKADPVVLLQKPASVSLAETPQATVTPPGAAKKKKGFLGRVKGFFGSIFHR